MYLSPFHLNEAGLRWSYLVQNHGEEDYNLN